MARRKTRLSATAKEPPGTAASHLRLCRSSLPHCEAGRQWLAVTAHQVPPGQEVVARRLATQGPLQRPRKLLEELPAALAAQRGDPQHRWHEAQLPAALRVESCDAPPKQLLQPAERSLPAEPPARPAHAPAQCQNAGQLLLLMCASRQLCRSSQAASTACRALSACWAACKACSRACTMRSIQSAA